MFPSGGEGIGFIHDLVYGNIAKMNITGINPAIAEVCQVMGRKSIVNKFIPVPFPQVRQFFMNFPGRTFDLQEPGNRNIRGEEGK